MIHGAGVVCHCEVTANENDHIKLHIGVDRYLAWTGAIRFI